jgi:hypothetical protein
MTVSWVEMAGVRGELHELDHYINYMGPKATDGVNREFVD